MIFNTEKKERIYNNMPQQIPAVSMGFLNCLRALSQAWSHELLSGSSYDANPRPVRTFNRELT